MQQEINNIILFFCCCSDTEFFYIMHVGVIPITYNLYLKVFSLSTFIISFARCVTINY